MVRLIVWAALFLGAAAVFADEPVLLPAPRVNTLPDPSFWPGAKRVPSQWRPPEDAPKAEPGELDRETARLRSERAALQNERKQMDQRLEEACTPATTEVARLRLRLGELLLQLNSPRTPMQPSMPEVPNGPVPGKPAAPEKPATGLVGPTEPQPPAAEGTGRLVDPMALAQSLFRAGDYEGALGTYRLLDLSALENDERASIQYLMACCLRMLGKFEDAATLYREVANAKHDPVLADCAQWQLGMLGWRRDLEAQLLQLRNRRQAVEIKP